MCDTYIYIYTHTRFRQVWIKRLLFPSSVDQAPILSVRCGSSAYSFRQVWIKRRIRRRRRRRSRGSSGSGSRSSRGSRGSNTLLATS